MASYKKSFFLFCSILQFLSFFPNPTNSITTTIKTIANQASYVLLSNGPTESPSSGVCVGGFTILTATFNCRGLLQFDFRSVLSSNPELILRNATLSMTLSATPVPSPTNSLISIYLIPAWNKTTVSYSSSNSLLSNGILIVPATNSIPNGATQGSVQSWNLPIGSFPDPRTLTVSMALINASTTIVFYDSENVTLSISFDNVPTPQPTPQPSPTIPQPITTFNQISDSNENASSTSTIVGIVVGIIVLLLCIGFVVILVLYIRRKRQNSSSSEKSTEMTKSPSETTNYENLSKVVAIQSDQQPKSQYENLNKQTQLLQQPQQQQQPQQPQQPQSIYENASNITIEQSKKILPEYNNLPKTSNEIRTYEVVSTTPQKREYNNVPSSQ